MIPISGLLLSHQRRADLVGCRKSSEVFFFLKHSDRCLRNIKELASLGSEQKNSLGIIWELRVFGGTQVRCSFLNLSVQKNELQGRAMNVT